MYRVTDYAYCEVATLNRGSVSYLTSDGQCPGLPVARTCQDCVQQNTRLRRTTFSHSSARYLWNLNQQYCMIGDLTAILDVSHIGKVVHTVASCLTECSAHTRCLACQAQPNCGWCSVASSSTSGVGVCMEGTRTNGSNCRVEILRQTLRLELAAVEWNYMSCPLENECMNRHHTCELKVQRCVDQDHGESHIAS